MQPCEFDHDLKARTRTLLLEYCQLVLLARRAGIDFVDTVSGELLDSDIILELESSILNLRVAIFVSELHDAGMFTSHESG